MSKTRVSISLAVLALFALTYLWGQSSTTFTSYYNKNWDVPGAVVPATATVVTSAAIVDPMLDGIVLSNVSGATQTVTISDNSTNCNSTVCSLPPITIASHTLYTVPMYGVRFKGGVKIDAGGNANTVDFWMKGRY